MRSFGKLKNTFEANEVSYASEQSDQSTGSHFDSATWSVYAVDLPLSFACKNVLFFAFMPPHIFDTLFSRSQSYACESWAVHNIIVLSSVTMIDDFCSMCESLQYNERKINHNIDRERNFGNIRIPFK